MSTTEPTITLELDANDLAGIRSRLVDRAHHHLDDHGHALEAGDTETAAVHVTDAIMALDELLVLLDHPSMLRVYREQGAREARRAE